MNKPQTDQPGAARTKEPEVIERRTAGGQTLVYAAHPGIVLQELPDHRHTGVCDFEWSEAQAHIGDHFTPREVRAGWPLRLSPARLANLQFPHERNVAGEYLPTNASARQNWVLDALTGLCERGEIKGEPIHRIMRDESPSPQPPMQWLEYWIDPRTFLNWLTGHGLEPSRFIAAWCKANGMPMAAPAVTPDKYLEHFKRRLLGVATERLKDRPALLPRFQQEMELGGWVPAMERAGLLGALIAEREGHPEAGAVERHAVHFIDEWARAQPGIAPMPPAPATPPRILKRRVLVSELGGDWQTIDADLKEASRNGLDAAKVDGGWDVEKARAWAKDNGKLTRPAQPERPRQPAGPWDRLGRR